MSLSGTSYTHSNVTDDSRAPILFYKPKMALIGPEALITVPKAAQPVEKHVPDWEVELTVVIGKPCKDVSESEALDYVLGYMTGNDVRLEFVCFHAKSILTVSARLHSVTIKWQSRNGDFRKALVSVERSWMKEFANET